MAASPDTIIGNYARAAWHIGDHQPERRNSQPSALLKYCRAANFDSGVSCRSSVRVSPGTESSPMRGVALIIDGESEKLSARRQEDNCPDDRRKQLCFLTATLGVRFRQTLSLRFCV